MLRMLSASKAVNVPASVQFFSKAFSTDLYRLRKAHALVRAKKAKAQAANSITGSMAKPVIQGVIFDMDGTLTEACIDFVAMRRCVGIMEGDILDVISKMSPSDRDQAHSVLADFEAQALKDMRLMPGVEEVAGLLDSRGVPRGIITRNVLSSVDHFHNQVFRQPNMFAPALARCFTPYKPSPHGILHICEKWGIDPSACVMVGDSAKDDIVAGNRAGARTILIDVERAYDLAALPAEQQPTFHVHSMHQVREVLQSECELVAPHGGATGSAEKAQVVM